MDYHTAVEEACKYAHQNADETARHGDYGGTYLKHLAMARFYELAATEDVDLSDKSVGDISVDVLRGTGAVQQAEDDA